MARARSLGVRLLGPNSMGVVNLPGRVALTVNAVLEIDAPPAGSTSLVSQSGTMLGTLLSRGAARGLGYAKLVSVGNEADLGVAELVELLIDDADTRVIALFLETVRDAERLARAARARSGRSTSSQLAVPAATAGSSTTTSRGANECGKRPSRAPKSISGRCQR